MTIRLRPHHLLCFLTYVGRGYSPAFVANYDVISQRLSAGEDILIVAGPDDICAPVVNDPDGHCLLDSVVQRDAEAAQDVGTLLGLNIDPGIEIRLDAPMLDRMRQAFAAGHTRTACQGCEWHDLCTTIATEGFAGTRVRLC